MNRIGMAFVLMGALAIPSWAAGTSAGGGVSVFVPETLYQDGKGSLAFEQGFSTALGLGDVLSVPVGFAYFAAEGFRLEHSDVHAVSGPTLFGDSLMPYLMVKAHVGLGPVYAEAFGGGVLDWAFSLSATNAFASALAKAGESVAITTLNIDRRVGYGWQAGGALGVTVGKISVDLGATYRSILIPLNIQTNIKRVDALDTVTSEKITLTGATAVLRGISFSLGGSYAF